MKVIFSAIISIFTSPFKRSLLLLIILGLIALFEFLSLGLTRRTFVFHFIDGGVVAVEDRMIKRANSKENDITRYTEEALRGPVSQDLLPLFPYETKLKTLMLRGDTVFADFSESAALRLPENLIKGGGRYVLDNFCTLYDSILRNFPYVSNVWFFIEGNAISLDYRREPGWEPEFETRSEEAIPADGGEEEGKT